VAASPSKARIRPLRALSALAVLSVFSALIGSGVLLAPTAGAAAPAPGWSTGSPPSPADANTSAPGLTVNATTCSAPGNCVSVGHYDDSINYQHPLIETESGGTTTAMEGPLPSNGGTDLGGTAHADLASVSCTSSTFCVAVGTYRNNDHSTDSQYGLIETLNNGTWTATQAPEPANSASEASGFQSVDLSDVVCPTSSSCTAIGSYLDSDTFDSGMIDTLSNGVWSTIEAPQPADGGTDGDGTKDVELNSLSCSSPTFCTTVGNYQADTIIPEEFGLIVTGSGSSWAASAAPEPDNHGTSTHGHQDAELLTVSCPSDGVCAAGGDYDDDAPGAYQWGMLETLSAGVWSVVSTPVPTGAGTGSNQFAEADSIDCPVSGSCVSVGQYRDDQGREWGLINTLSGGTWTSTQAPEPPSADTNAADGPVSELGQVSCSWPGQCVAVGQAQASGFTEIAMIDTLSNGAWSSIAAPLPSDASSPSNGDMLTVDCAAAFCSTSGSYDASSGDETVIDTYQGTGGYDLVASDGGLFSYNVPFFGSMGGQPLNEPVVGMSIVPSNDGYYEVASDGGIFAFNAPFYGSMGGKPLNAPIVGIAFNSRTGGYYEVASDGGIFAFNAPFYGSMGGMPLNKPIVGIAYDQLTGGYYEVASDGGLFAFNAPFLGSTGNITLNKPVVGMTVDTATGGYYEVASDGGLFAYGSPFLGSMGGQPLNKPVVGMAYDYFTNGYFEVATDGGLFAFGAPFQGSTGSIALNKPVVGMTIG
jgi:hypothetical protein